MGWWSLGPEDEETMEIPPTLTVRRVRGGAGRVPGPRGKDHVASSGRKKTRTRSPRRSKQTKSPKKKRPRVIGTPKEEEESNLFATIGRMVNSTSNRRYYASTTSDDLSTLGGTAKYPGQNGIPIKALNNANEAQRRANEMANAMAWLTNPTATTTATTTAQESLSQAESDLFQENSENWWESCEEANDITPLALEPEEMPDLMALLKLGKTSSYIVDNDMKPKKETKKFKTKGKELTAEKQANDLQRSLQWLQNNSTSYVHEQLDYEYNEEPFQTVDAGFGQWKPKTTRSVDWERYDPREQPKEAERIAKDLKQSLDLILNGNFDNNNPSLHDGPVIMNRLKDLFADWKFRENDGSKELEDALSWCKLHARNYDPTTASEEETDKFLESKRLLALLGFKDEDVWDERKREMEDALALWASYQNKPMQDLDEDTIEKMNKIKDVLVQIKRDGLIMNDMTYMAKEMDGVLTWYLDKGCKMKDFSKVKKSYQSKFLKACGLLSLWGRKVDPLPDRLKDIVELLLALEENNKYSSEIIDKYNGEEVARFQKIQDAVMDWKFKGLDADSTAIAMNNEAVANDIEGVLDWWVANGENFRVETANEDEVYMARIAENILDVWIPHDSGEAFSFQGSKIAVEELKGALALYRNAFEEPEIVQELSQNMIKGDGINSRQRNPAAMSWVRKGAGHEINDNSEPCDVEDPESEFNSCVPAVRSEEEKRAQEMSSALDWLRRNDAELDIDDDMSVALSVATFKKIDALMPRTGDDRAPTTMDDALDWMRSKTTLDDETVSSFKSVDDILMRSGAFDTIKEGGFAAALEWLRKRQTKKAASFVNVESSTTYDDNDTERVAVAVIPKTEDEKRAEQMEIALNWLRSNDPAEDVSVGSAHASLGIGFASPSTILSINPPGDKASQSELDWLRSRAATTIEKSTFVPKGAEHIAGQSLSAEDKRANETTVAPHWFRCNEANIHSSDGSNGESEFETTGAFGSVSLISNEEQKIEDVDTQQSWMRNSFQNGCDVVDERLFGAQGVKPMSFEEMGISQMDNAVDWSRTNQNVDSATKATTKPITTTIPCDRTPKQRSRDVEKILQWMRKGKGKGQKKEDKYDPTGEYRKLESMLQIKIGETLEERCLEIERALDWVRGPSDASEHGMQPTFDWSNFGFVPIGTRSSSSQQRSKNLDSTYGWSTNEGSGPKEQIPCIDNILWKKSQDACTHERKLGSVFDWNRNHTIDEDITDDDVVFDKIGSKPVSSQSLGDSCTKADEPFFNWLRNRTGDLDGLAGEFATVDESSRKVLENEQEAVQLDWMRFQGSPTDLRDDTLPLNRLCDVNIIPRDDLPPEVSNNDAGWSMHINRLFPGVPDERISCGSHGMLNAIPSSRETSQDSENHDLDWIRHPGIEAQFDDETGSYCKSRDIQLIPLDGPPKSENMPNADWNRYGGEVLNPIPGEEHLSDRPQDVRSVPRTCRLHEAGFPELSWRRNPPWKIFQTEDEETISVFDRPGDLRSIPRSEKSNEEMYPSTGWGRVGSTKQEMKVHEGNIFDRPGDLRSIPRGVNPRSEAFLAMAWGRNGSKRQGLEGLDTVFDTPGDLRSIPRDCRKKESYDPEFTWERQTSVESIRGYCGNVFDQPRRLRSIPRDGHEFLSPIPGEEHLSDRPQDVSSVPRTCRLHEAGFPELSWRRNPAWKINETEDEETISIFDRPGDLRSIPRSEKSNEEMYPSTGWGRVGSTKQEMKVHEGNIFDRPGDLRSIPRGVNPRSEAFPTMTWGRNGSRLQGPEVLDTVFDTPGDLRSIPRDYRQKESYGPEFTWERQASVESIPAMYYGNVFDQPRRLRSIPREGHPPDEPGIDGERHFENMSSAHCKKMDLELDWSGGRPNRLLAVEPSLDWIGPEPAKWESDDATYDWMITSPKGKDASYDWSGARPYERPETNLVSLSATSLDEASSGVNNRLPDDLSDSTELGEEKPRPVTGVPCAAWTMLALGAAAGGAMGSSTSNSGVAVASQFANNNSVGSTTDRLYPDPGALPSCSTDANCAIIMDGLSPVLPPDVLGLFDLPGTCQTKARDWLRTGKDILEFKAERIRQRYAMSVFFCEMDGGDWIQGDSWLSDLHECDWYNKVGLDPCNRREQMEMLRVTDNGLAGTMPVELFILSNLYEFTLANNMMSGTLPQLFDKFKELDTLVIPFNQFEGSFPHQVWEYPDMVYLDVAYNGFTGTIPTDIDTRMPNLQVAFLENNNLSGPIPENLGNLRQLHRLHLDDNKFTGNIPPTLGLPPRISELLLHDNLLTGEVPRELGDLNRLQLLTLHYNSFDEQTIDEHICDLIYNKQLELATVDKATIDCGCCASGEESFV
eukprot:CAMPEP_0113635072 /NCGR_PEP_ID=MMETSP0017_2-20120614/18273_1 /TAXON_ID=2856 /ORGANISM="Cylindrotheca closterium" /LENGTH=2343 /DNA_ID=CAMNT_0000545819 /DNA_START=71 /DNA_END=7102 /DNA_ORIENTATION=- /assembly_acc=CAM_ASM_000147